MEIKNTSAVKAAYLKALVYGQSGAGKTSLAKTIPGALVISCEAGLLPLKGAGVDFVEVKNLDSLREAYEFLLSDKKYTTVILDSVSEIAEVVLSEAKKEAKDPRQAYGAMHDSMTDLIRAFRDLPEKNVVFIAKAEKTQDETGKLLWSPAMPGQKLGQNLPYFFDLVLALRVEKNPEGELVRVLQTGPDTQWNAKDRSGALEMWEPADLGAVFSKINKSGEKK